MPSKKHVNHKEYEQATAAYEWTAPGRPFRRRSKQFFLTALLITLFVEIILFLFSEYLLMLVVASLVFVTFALATIPPRDFKYRVSNEGIQVEDKFYLWQELYDFYFWGKKGEETVHVRTKDFIPGELILTLGSTSEDDVKKAIIPHLPFREYVKPSFVDKAADWLSRNFPFENQ